MNEREMLQSIADGQFISQLGKDPHFLTARLLFRSAVKSGYIADPHTHDSSEGGEDPCDMIWASRLTVEGKARLAEINISARNSYYTPSANYFTQAPDWANFYTRDGDVDVSDGGHGECAWWSTEPTLGPKTQRWGGNGHRIAAEHYEYADRVGAIIVRREDAADKGWVGGKRK